MGQMKANFIVVALLLLSLQSILFNQSRADENSIEIEDNLDQSILLNQHDKYRPQQREQPKEEKERSIRIGKCFGCKCLDDDDSNDCCR